MAVVEFFKNPPKTLKSLKGSLDYILSDIKTDKHLIGGYNCNILNPFEDFKLTKQIYNKLDGRQGVHFTQSFDKNDNITPDKALLIANELTEFYRFKDYQISYAVHTDKDHIHTHFIINTVNLETGKKWQQSKKQMEELKEFSDNICLKHNLSVINRNYKKSELHTTRGGIEAKNKNSSWTTEIRLAVEQCSEISISKDDFRNKLKDLGYDFIWEDTRKYITFFSMKNSKQKIRNNKLVPAKKFTKESLLSRFELNNQGFRKGETEFIHQKNVQDIDDIKNNNMSNVASEYPLNHKAKNNETIEKDNDEKAIKYELFLAVNICKNKSFSKDDFINKMKRLGYEVDWKDRNKTFKISNEDIALRNSQLYPREKFTIETLEKQFILNNEKLEEDKVNKYFESLVIDINSDDFKEFPLTSLKSERLNQYSKEWRDDLISNIDSSVLKSTSKEEFIKLMLENGYDVNWNDEKNIITYTEIETLKFIRNIKIFPAHKYTTQSLLDTFDYNKYYYESDIENKKYIPINNYTETKKAIKTVSEYSFDEDDFKTKMNKLGYDVSWNEEEYKVTNKSNNFTFSSNKLSSSNNLNNKKLSKKMELNVFKNEKEANEKFDIFLKNFDEIKENYSGSFLYDKTFSALSEERGVLYDKQYAKEFYRDLNKAIFKSDNKDDFIKTMESFNYDVNWDTEKEQLIFKDKATNCIIRDIILYPQEQYSMKGILNTFKCKEVERKLVKDLDDSLIFAETVDEFEKSLNDKGFDIEINDIEKSVEFFDKESQITISSKNIYPPNKYRLDSIKERLEYNKYYFNVGKNNEVKEISFNYKPTTKSQETLKAINIALEHSFEEDDFINKKKLLDYDVEFYEDTYKVQNLNNGFVFSSEKIAKDNYLNKDKLIKRIDLNTFKKDEEKEINEKFESIIKDCKQIKEVYYDDFFKGKSLSAIAEENNIAFNKNFTAKLKKSIDESIKVSFSEKEFVEKMNDKGFNVQFSENGFIVFEDTETGYKLRNTKLFPENKYSIERFKDTIEYNKFFYKIERSATEYKVPTYESETFKAMVEASKYSISRDDFTQKLYKLGYEVRWYENYYDVVSKSNGFEFSTKYISLESDLYIEKLEKQLYFNNFFKNKEKEEFYDKQFDKLLNEISEVREAYRGSLFDEKPLLAMSEEKRLLFNKNFSKEFYSHINKAIYQSTNKKQFISNLDKMNYKVEWNDEKNFIRFTNKDNMYSIKNTLLFPDERYSTQNLNKIFELNRIQNISSIFNLLSKFEDTQTYNSNNRVFGRSELKGDKLKDKIIEQNKGSGLEWEAER